MAESAGSTAYYPGVHIETIRAYPRALGYTGNPLICGTNRAPAGRFVLAMCYTWIRNETIGRDGMPGMRLVPHCRGDISPRAPPKELGMKVSDTTVRFRSRPDDRNAYAAAAANSGITLSEWVRRACNRAIRSAPMDAEARRNLVILRMTLNRARDSVSDPSLVADIDAGSRQLASWLGEAP